MTQAFGRGVWAIETGGGHDGMTARQPVTRDQGHRRAPRSLPRTLCSSRTPWTRFRVSSRAGAPARRGRRRCGAFQTFDNQHAGVEVDAISGERQGFGQTEVGIGQRHAEGPHLTIGPLGLVQEGVALAGREVFAGAIDRVQPHAHLCDRRGPRDLRVPRGRGGHLGLAGSRARDALAGERGRDCVKVPPDDGAGWNTRTRECARCCPVSRQRSWGGRLGLPGHDELSRYSHRAWPAAGQQGC